MSDESDLRTLSSLTEGHIVVMPPVLQPHQQRLLAGLGVLVRFDMNANQDEFLTRSRKRLPNAEKPKLWQRILEAMEDGHTHTPLQLSQEIGVSRNDVVRVLRGLVEDHDVVRLKRGYYRKRIDKS